MTKYQRKTQVEDLSVRSTLKKFEHKECTSAVLSLSSTCNRSPEELQLRFKKKGARDLHPALHYSNGHMISHIIVNCA